MANVQPPTMIDDLKTDYFIYYDNEKLRINMWSMWNPVFWALVGGRPLYSIIICEY